MPGSIKNSENLIELSRLLKYKTIKILQKDHKYSFSEIERTWEEAIAECQFYGGQFCHKYNSILVLRRGKN